MFSFIQSGPAFSNSLRIDLTRPQKISIINSVRDTKDIMALKTYKKIDKKGHEEIWEWEETPELRAFIKKQSITKLATPPTRPQ